MEQVKKNVFAETGIRGCNPGYVVTSEGVVVVDTPQLPTHAIKMRQEAEQHGPIRYLINTELHVDHIFGNYYFKGAGTVVSHVETDKMFMVETPQIKPYEYAWEAIPTDDPEGEKHWPEKGEYFKDPNRPTVTFTGDLTLRVGGHTFELIHTPGHTPGQLAVYVPEERVAFLGDTIFHKCQTWLYASNVEQWIKSLDKIKELDVDTIIPGHGPVCDKKELDVQKALLLEWLSVVAGAVAKGLSKQEAVREVEHIKNRFPVDIGQEYMLDHIMENNVSALYDKFVAQSAE